MGLPLTNGFVAKWLLFDAALEARQAVVIVVAWAVSILTTFSFMKATLGVFYGMPAPGMRIAHEASPTMLAGMVVTAAMCLLFGFAPQLLMQPIVAPAVQGMGFTWDVRVTWFGVVTGSGTIGVTLGAAAGLLAAAGLGLVGYLVVRVPVPARTVAVFTGGDPLPEGDTLGVVDFAEMAEAAFGPVYAADPDPLWLRIWSGVRDGAQEVRAIAERLERRPLLVAAAGVLGLLAAVVL